MDTRASYIANTLLLVLAVTLTACTIVGGIIGSIASSEAREIPGWRVVELDEGDRLAVVLRDGTLVSGRYLGINQMHSQEYAEIWSRRMATSNLSLPFSPNDTISLQLADGGSADGTFAGLYLYEGALTIMLRPESGPMKPFRTEDVLAVANGNREATPIATISQMGWNGELPVGTQVLIEDSILKHIELGSIRGALLPGQNYTLQGFLVGGLVDVVILVAAVVSYEEPELGLFGEGEESFSCPYVYSYTGTSYELDSEPFGGAFFRAAQRTDWDNLDHLRSVGDSYRLRITNELRETQYVDAVRLLVVDHPIGTRVVPSFEGKLHVLSEPRSPETAVDFSGSSVLSEVASSDAKFWISNPFNRGGGSYVGARDELELTFANPDGAAFATLALRLQNTFWASYLQGQILALQGDRLEAWYDALNTSTEARAELAQAMIREGMLQIDVWDGNDWKSAGHIWEVGPALPKDQALELDLSAIDTPEVRIRLSSTVGLWMIDSVVLDYASDPPLVVRELRPSSAVDQTGRDVVGLISEVDEQHVVMPAPTDKVDVTFDAVATTPESNRTMVLKATGYYTIHPPTGTTPADIEFVDRLVREPGAYGKYTLHLLDEHTTRALRAIQAR